MKKALFITLLVIVLFEGVSFGDDTVYTIKKGIVCDYLSDLIAVGHLSIQKDYEAAFIFVKQGKCAMIDVPIEVYKIKKIEVFTQFRVKGTLLIGWAFDVILKK